MKILISTNFQYNFFSESGAKPTQTAVCSFTQFILVVIVEQKFDLNEVFKHVEYSREP